MALFSTAASTYAVAVAFSAAALCFTSTTSSLLGYQVEAFTRDSGASSGNSNKQQPRKNNNKQHDKFKILESIDFTSNRNGGRRSLQEFEITQTTTEFPVLISEVLAEEEDGLTTIYNSSDVSSETPADVTIYGCTTAGLFTALRLLEPELTQDTIRDDVLATSEDTDGSLNVVIMEPSDRCGGRMLTAQYDDSFLAELGDMGYYSSSKAYADVLMEYLELDTKSVQSMVMDNNMIYLRGNYLRGNQSPIMLSNIYQMNFIERGQTASDLMIHAVDMLLPGAFDYNETEWYTLFMEASSMPPSEEEKYMNKESLSPYLLTKTGFWNALSHVLSNEAIELVSTYFEDTLNIQSNMNALESIVCIVMMVNSYDGPNAGGGMKTPILGMESIVIELQQRVLDAGGLIALNAMMNELVLNNATTEEVDPTANATSGTYDVSFVVTGQGLVELTGVGNVVFATEYDSSDSSTINDALSRVMLTSDFFEVNEEEIVGENTNTTTVVMNGTIDEIEISASRLSYVEPMLTIQNALMARVPIDYARLYICYDTPWWNTPALGITSGRSVTDLPINTVMYYTDASCLAICSSGTSASYWKHMANGASSKMFLSSTQIEEMMVDFTVWETRWDELSANTPQVVIDDAHRQLKLLHNLQYIPLAKSAIFVTNDMVGDSQRMTVPGINPDALAEYMLRPRNEWNVFFVGESYGVGFPYQGLEADLASSENLVQMYFYNQPEPFTFDSTGELTNEELTQTGLAISSSSDGSRIAVVSSSQYDPLKGEVTIYQRIGDEFLGLWKSIGTNFVSDSTVVDLREATSTGNQTEPIIPEVPIVEDEPEVDEPEVPPVSNETEVGEEIIDEVFIDETDNTTATTNTTNSTRRLSSSTYSRILVERTEMANMTSVALSGDGRIMAIGVVSAESGMGSVQLWMDTSNDASIGNWTKIGSELLSDDNMGTGEFGYSIDLSYDGSILAVGAPSRDQFGAVLVYDCSLLTKVANPNDFLQMNSDSSSSSSSSSTSAKDIRETFAPATGLLSGFDTSMMNGGSTSSGGSSSRTCVQMGKTMEGIDVVTRYGESVSLSYDGRAVAAGAPNTGSTVPQVGYASVFSYSQETSDWSQAGNLIAGEETEDQFGFSVSLSADARHLAIGAPGVGTSTTSSGYARVYTFGVTTDVSTGELILDWLPSGSIDGIGVGDNVGFSVALSGDAMRLFVGAPQLDSDADSGGFVFALMQDIANPGNWTLYEGNGELSGTTPGDSMGYSVASDYEGSNIALGAPQVTTNGQGVVRTFVYVEPPPTLDEEVSVVDETTDIDPEIIARMIWADAMLEDRPYPWLEDDPCVQGPELINPDDPNTAMLALADTMSMALIDSRLTEEVEQALVFNMDHNVPMIQTICLPLLDAANIVSIDETLDVQTRVRLDLSITAYEETLVVDLPQVPTIPTPAPTESEVVDIPVSNETIVGNETMVVGNETDIGLEGIMPPPEGIDENEFEPLPELTNETSAENRTTITDIVIGRTADEEGGGGGGKQRRRGDHGRRRRNYVRRNRQRGLLG